VRSGAGTSAHADPRFWVEANLRFVVPYSPQTGLQLVLGHHDEPEMFVERAVPGNVDEGSEGEGWASGVDRPRVHRFEQLLTESPTLVVRKDADLLDVGVSIYEIDNDVAQRTITPVHGNPAASAACVLLQELDRHGLRVGYPLHSDRPERFAGEALDLSEPRRLGRKGWANAGHPPNTCAPGRHPCHSHPWPQPPLRPRLSSEIWESVGIVSPLG
jgi:hypothetical protein